MRKYEKDAVNRIKELTGLQNILDILSKDASLSDLNSFLLDIYKIRMNNSQPSELLRKYSKNRFVRPADICPIKLKELEIELLRIAKSSSYYPLLLSPVAPLGSCSTIATVDQNKIISALRGTEVAADPTNSLALYICEKLKKGDMNNKSEFIRYSTTQRVVRAQSYSKPGLIPHFNLFCLVTSGVDSGSYSFEKKALLEQIELYHKIFQTLYHKEISIKFFKSKGYKDSEGLIQRITDYFNNIAPSIKIENFIESGENLYYQGLQYKIIIKENGQAIEIGDGGIVDWSQKLIGNKKERMLISGIGLDRLLSFY